MIGQTLGQYRITGELGAGGMGEVWRAEDTKLGREVALKVLPEEFAADPERMARFEREAKVLASLNHPNIATLYGLETVPSGTETETGAETVFLAMELVEGEDLSQRIERGPIPVEEATDIALQIAEALEAAHEQGIVHRDLKPANIKLRPDGTVKVLDFGLAKAWAADGSDSSLSMSPTLTAHATAAGVILGTAAYMAPEQAAGTAADRRADIWAFGVVLWEMLTGHRLFEGETVSHVLASVLKDEIDLEALPTDTPVRLRELIGRCLRKKPKQRLQAIGDARIVLEEYRADPTAVEAAAHEAVTEILPAPRWAKVLPWALAAALAAVLAIALWFDVSNVPRIIKATIPPPDGTEFSLAPARPGPVAVSPDGRKVAFSARDEDGNISLFLRNLDADRAVQLSGTEGAQYPFWSPDSRWIAFSTQTDGKMKKIDTMGGPPITLCEAANGKGGTWNEDGVIVFAPDASGPLYRVSSAGGEASPITEVDAARHNSHRHPRFLPDGQHFLYLARATGSEGSAVMVGSLDGGESRELLKTSTEAEFASGHLLFLRDRTLMAQPFDPGKLELTGEAVPLAENVLVVPGASLAVFSTSATDIVTYLTGQGEAKSQLEWYDRNGKLLGSAGDAAYYRVATLSPDGRLAVSQINDEVAGTPDLWIYEVDRDLRTRFTFDLNGDTSPVWSADSGTVFFASNRNGSYDIFRKTIGGAGEVEPVLVSDTDTFPSGVSADGRLLLYQSSGEETKADLWVLDMAENGAPQPFRNTEFDEALGRFSPDGRWVAYLSNESGQPEIYVTPYPGPGRRWQVSSDSGVYPQWRADGNQIVYTRLDGQLVAVAVHGSQGNFEVGQSEDLFTIQAPLIGGPFFSMTGDGERFLVVPSAAQRADNLLNLVVNWPLALEARR